MKIPKGMNEEQVLTAIENVVNALARNFRFGYFDTDDMKQQGRMYTLEGIPKYNPEVGPLENFLRTHIRNRFINLKRNKLTRYQPPCVDCPFYDPECKVSQNKCSEFKNKEDCQKYSNWQKRNIAKKSLAQPLDISNINDEREKNMRREPKVYDFVTKKELLEIIDKELPISYRRDYRRMVEGVNIPKQRKQKLIDKLKEIIKENYPDEW